MIVRGQKTFLSIIFLAVDKHDIATFDFHRTHDLVLRLFDCLISLLPLSLSLGPSLDCRVLFLSGRVHIKLLAELRVLIRGIERVDISSTHHMAVLVYLFNLGKKF